MLDPLETVLITGASTGIGLAAARAFHGQGANMVLNASNADRLNDAYDSLGRPNNVHLVVGDIADKSVGQRMVDDAVKAFGRVDVLVNNAGIFSPKPFLEVEEADLDRFLDVNLKGTYFTTQAAISVMQNQGGGAVINIGTVLVNHAIGGLPVSAPMTSKGGIHALTLQLAAEFGKDNIRVNTIAPGIIRTPIHARNGIENVEDLSGLSLLGSVGESEEVADAILHLASANFTSGMIYALDGGHQAGHHLS